MGSMFITFEGPEGAGKTTAVAAVVESLRAQGRDVLSTREPGSGEVGKRLRELVLTTEMDSTTELFLFLADRSNHVATEIRPALAAGRVVVCDRFSDSTIVYQGYGRGLDLTILRSFNIFATSGLKPDLTILLDLEAEVGLARLKEKDRMDSQPLAFHKKIREGFLAESRREPDRWVVVDASEGPDEVARKAMDAVARMLVTL